MKKRLGINASYHSAGDALDETLHTYSIYYDNGITIHQHYECLVNVCHYFRFTISLKLNVIVNSHQISEFKRWWNYCSETLSDVSMCVCVVPIFSRFLPDSVSLSLSLHLFIHNAFFCVVGPWNEYARHIIALYLFNENDIENAAIICMRILKSVLIIKGYDSRDVLSMSGVRFHDDWQCRHSKRLIVPIGLFRSLSLTL